MGIQVLFFGATADIVGGREIVLDIPPDLKSGELMELLVRDYPQLINHRLLFSINQNYANGDEVIRDGDEFAIFTAVSGG